jgi:hypothetical protein
LKVARDGWPQKVLESNEINAAGAPPEDAA